MGFKEIYRFANFKLKFKSAEKLGLIQDFPEELWKEIEKHYYYGLPLGVALKTGFSKGKCYDMAYALTMAFDKCNLIQGHLPEFGKIENISFDPDFAHSWVEDDKYVYDTTFVKRFDKEFYRSFFGARIESIISSEELNKKDEYGRMKSTTKKDIEGSIGTEAVLATLLSGMLEEKEQTSGKDLSHLRCQVPQIDMAEFRRKRDAKLEKYLGTNR